MVELPPLVKKGDRVILLVENHQFKITALGEVKEEGRRGDLVNCQSVEQKGSLTGRF